MPNSYIFDLAVSTREAGYCVQVQSAYGVENLPDALLVPFDLATLSRSRLEVETWMRRARASQTGDGTELREARALGGALFKQILANDNLACFQASRAALGAGDRLQLRLHLPEELSSLPWELLYDPKNGEFLALADDLTLARYPHRVVTDTALQINDSLQIVTVAADLKSQNGQWSQPSAELDQIAQAIGMPWAQGHLALEVIEGDDVLARLRERLRRPIHVLHILCYVDTGPNDGDTMLLFRNARGDLEPVSIDLLRLQFQRWRRRPQLVVLSLRASPLSDGRLTFAQMGTMLLHDVPAVLISQFAIDEAAAANLWIVFYAELAAGVSVDEALGRARARFSAGSRGLDWAAPALFLRSNGSQLFNLPRRAIALPSTIGPVARPDAAQPSTRDLSGPGTPFDRSQGGTVADALLNDLLGRDSGPPTALRTDVPALLAPDPPARSAVPPGPPTNSVQLMLSQDLVSVNAGDTTTVLVTVANRGSLVDQIAFEISGLPETFVTLTPPSVSLFPGAQAEIALSIHPPRTSSALAGMYQFQVAALSNVSDPAVVDATLTIRPFYAYSLSMTPRRRSTIGTATFQITIANDGNAELPVMLEGEDDEQKLSFDFSSEEFAVPAGGETTVPVRIRAGLALVGSSRAISFSIRARRNAKVDSMVASGLLTHRPLLPLWSMWILLMLVLALIAVRTVPPFLRVLAGRSVPEMSTTPPTRVDPSATLQADEWIYTWQGDGQLLGRQQGGFAARGTYLVVQVNVTNNAADPRMLSPDFFILRDGQGRIYHVLDQFSNAYARSSGAPGALENAVPASGGQARVALIFDIQPDATQLTLVTRDKPNQGWRVLDPGP